MYAANDELKRTVTDQLQRHETIMVSVINDVKKNKEGCSQVFAEMKKEKDGFR